MKSAPEAGPLRRLWAHDAFLYSLRVFLALAAAMALGWTSGRMDLVMPLFLGTIACALAETDDSWRGRLRAVLATLACFAAAAFGVQALSVWPWVFAAALSLAAFGLTLLGAVGDRYRAIAAATLVLAIYSAMELEGAAARGSPAWREPALLLAGAGGYGLLSVAWAALFTLQPVRQNMARLYQALAEYLWIKSSLLEPVRGVDVEGRRIALARCNGDVVAALNATRESLFRRTGAAPAGPGLRRYLALYFIAQDVHERASSSHHDYAALTEAFFHSDVLFRCQRLLAQQGRACRALGQALRLGRPWRGAAGQPQGMADLRSALARLQDEPAARAPARARLLHALAALADNLAGLDAQLASARHPVLAAGPDEAITGTAPSTLHDAAARLRAHLSPASALFRHGLRMGLAMGAGFVALHLLHPRNGYWILLTALFVCQPGYGATRRRMVQRIAGTLCGLAVGWALFRVFPDLLLQSLFAALAGAVFFATGKTRYTLATGAITLVVLLCSNQTGNGLALVVPRLVDTLVGALIAGCAVFFVLPEWHARRLEQVAAQVVATAARYLGAIALQYHEGKRDHLAYRQARRDAHDADAALSEALAGMLQEPGFLRRRAEPGIRFLAQSHALLNYLSALGAHRGRENATPALTDAAARVQGWLDRLAADLAAGHMAQEGEARDGEALALAEALERASDKRSTPDATTPAGAAGAALPAVQLALVCRHLPLLRAAARRLPPGSAR
ncbi:MAG: YccS family putative transporter [Pseudomonadota bacterium]